MNTPNCTPLPAGSAPLTLTEIIVKALGARYPVTVARLIPSDCRDIPAAVESLRRRMPHWFETREPAAASQ